MGKRNRRIFSIKNELLKKSQESALSAIQIYNNPLISFKSESFIVLMVISWTYLMHAYYKDQKIDHRYYDQKTKRRKYHRTKYGAYKNWELQRCLDDKSCPLSLATKDNLKFLIGIRDEIEHQMTDKIDEHISAKFQACCINYNSTLKDLFGDDFSLDKIAPISLQLFSFGERQIDSLKNKSKLPQNLIEFISDFEENLSTKDNPNYSYRVIYLRSNANNEGQADSVYRFLDEESAEGKEIQNIIIKNKILKKITEKELVSIVVNRGYKKFTAYENLKLWKTKWANAAIRNKNASRFGELVVKNQWLWYEDKWLPVALEHCRSKYEVEAAS
jgi:hypothetical protein